jgi:hypothetical protein
MSARHHFQEVIMSWTRHTLPRSVLVMSSAGLTAAALFLGPVGAHVRHDRSDAQHHSADRVAAGDAASPSHGVTPDGQPDSGTPVGAASGRLLRANPQPASESVAATRDDGGDSTTGQATTGEGPSEPASPSSVTVAIPSSVTVTMPSYSGGRPPSMTGQPGVEGGEPPSVSQGGNSVTVTFGHAPDVVPPVVDAGTQGTFTPPSVRVDS